MNQLVDAATVVERAGTTREARQLVRGALERFESGTNWERKYSKPLNRPYVEPIGMQEPYWERISAYETSLGKDRTFYHYYGKNGKPVSSWVVDRPLNGYGIEEIKDGLAIADLPTHVTELSVKKGTKVRVSVAGQNDFGSGGFLQWEILEKDLQKTTTLIKSKAIEGR